MNVPPALSGAAPQPARARALRGRLTERLAHTAKAGAGCLQLTLILAAIFVVATARGRAQTSPSVQPRITAPIDETELTKLTGSTHPLARPEFDQGAVADSQPLRRMLLLLKRGPAQEATLRTLLDRQQSKSSPNYHQWLTPQQFGQQFGPADADVQTVSGWLQSHGFQVTRIAKSQMVIEFSGNAGQVREAFHTEIHKYVVNGEEHFANSRDPQIASALTPVVAGAVSLHNFPRKPQSHIAGVFSRSNATGTVKALKSIEELKNGNTRTAEFTFSSAFCPLNNTCYALAAMDFATIYDVVPLWLSNIMGTGQTIAIVGDSEICTTSSPDWQTQYVGPFGTVVTCNSDDIAAFRTQFGSLYDLAPSSPTIIVDGADPGFNPDETEGDLDVEWAGAVAPKAAVDFVIAEGTETTSGVDLAAEYAVDNNLAPVLSESFGTCEVLLGSDNRFYSSLWEQAAAQGITVVVAAGDSGSAGCDFPGAFAAQQGTEVNGIASTPFNVAAGGTDFDITAANYASTYWNIGNISPTQQSARSYIPETTWNDSCAQSFTGSLKGCDSPNLIGLDVVGGGGGQSSCSNLGAACIGGGYAKPPWQSGPYITGNPSTDGVRDLPDISFFSADGLVSGSFYIVCEADLDPNDTPCGPTATAPFTTFIGVGGTSSSAPAFAGVMALVNQQETILHGSNSTIPTRQGNANYVLYALANAQQRAALNCNSTAGPALACTFNDVTRGNNSVPCSLDTINCSANAPNPYGLLETRDSAGNLSGNIAYNSGAGYDLATGLGTVNVTNLVNNWQSVVGNFIPTTTTLAMCALPPIPPITPPCTPGTGAMMMTHGQTVDVAVTVAPTSGSGTPTGDVALVATGAQGGISHWTLSGGSVSSAQTVLPGGTYMVTAHYTGDGAFGGSDSNPISVTVTPANSTTTLTARVLNFVNQNVATFTTVGGGTVDFGDVVYLRADVSVNATGTVTFSDLSTSPAAVLGTVRLNSQSYAELQMGANLFGAPLPSLPVGPHNIQATYSGDASYNVSTSFTLPITVLAAPTTTTIQASAMNIPASSSITVSPNTMVNLTAFIDTQSTSNPSGGSFSNLQAGTELLGNVVFTVGNNTLGSSSMSSAMATVDSNGFIAAKVVIPFAPAAAQNLTINAQYIPATGNYLGSSTISPVTVNVQTNEGFTLMPSGAPNCASGFAGTCLNIPAPGQSATSPITISSIGLSGTVSLTCAVTPTNPADLQVPGCSFTLNGSANSTVTLMGNGSSSQRMLTITTTAGSALPVPSRHWQGPGWILTTTTLSLSACFLLLLTVHTRKLRTASVLVVLLFLIAGVAAGCGGSNSGGNTTNSTPVSNSGTGGSGASGSGGSSMKGPGTTADIYTVTVTATPSIGTAIQTQFVVFVQ